MPRINFRSYKPQKFATENLKKRVYVIFGQEQEINAQSFLI